MFRYRSLILKSIVGAIMLVLAFNPAFALAQDLSKFYSEGQSFLNLRQSLPGIDLVRKAMREVWSYAPIHLEKSQLTREKPKGYGPYDVRPSDFNKAGEIIRLYVEPPGFSRKIERDL